MASTVVSSGQTASGAVLQAADKQYVSGAGTALDTVVSSGGKQDVFGTSAGDGFASGTIVLSGGEIDSLYATLGNITVSAGGAAYLADGTTATNVIVDGAWASATFFSGQVQVTSLGVGAGGVVTNSAVGSVIDQVDIQWGGTMSNLSGSLSVVTVESGGLLMDQADVDLFEITNGGVVSALSGGALTEGTVDSGGQLVVAAGGTATSIQIQTGGNEFLLSGAVASGQLVAGGVVEVNSGATVTGDVITSGQEDIYGFAEITTISGGTQNVYGEADFGTVTGSGDLWVTSTGVVVWTTLSAGTMTVDGTALDTIELNGSALINSGGVMSNTILSAGTVEIAGIASSMTVYGGTVTLDSGGFASSGSFSGGQEIVLSGGSSIAETFSGQAEQLILAGGETASGIFLDGGTLYQNGTASFTTLDSGGSEYLSGSDTNGFLNSGSTLIISAGTATTPYVQGTVEIYGGALISANVDTGGLVEIHSGGLGSASVLIGDEVIDDGGIDSGSQIQNATVTVSAGGMAEDISDGGTLVVLSGGTTINGTVSAFAGANISAGGVMSGTILAGGAVEIAGNAFDMTITDGIVTVDAGGITSKGSFTGGNEAVGSGGSSIEESFSGQTWQAVSAGGVTVQTDLEGGAVQYLGGSATNNFVGSGSTEYIEGGSDTSATVDADSYQVMSSGYVADGYISGTLVVSGGVASGETIGAIGVAAVYTGGVMSAADVKSGGEADLYGGTAVSTTVGNGGILVVASGGLASATVVNGDGQLNILADGTASDVTIAGLASVLVNAGTVSATEASAVTGSGTLLNSGVIIASGLAVSLTGGYVENWGAITGGDSSDPAISITNATVVNFGTIVGTGGVALAFGSGYNQLDVISGSVISGLVSASSAGSTTVTLSNVGGGSVLSNFATQFVGIADISVQSGGAWEVTGTATLPTVSNLGTLLVDTGDDLTVTSATGSGAYLVSGQGVVDFAGGVASGVVVQLDGTGDELIIGDPADFSGSIADLSEDDTIDVAGLTYSGSTATLSGSTIQIDNGGTLYTLQLAAAISGEALALSADANGKLLLNLAPLVTMALASDTGASPSDGITASDGLTGLAAPNSTVLLTSGGVALGSATADIDGAWNFTPAFPDGTYTVTATQTDSDGHTGSAALTYTLETIVLGGTSIALAPASDSGVAGGDITNVTTPTLTGSGETGTTETLYDGATLLGSATVVAGGWSITVGSVLGDGDYTLTAVDTDLAGNSASAALAVTIDTAPDAAPGSIALDPASDSGVLGDGITNVTAPVIDGTGVAGDLVTLFDGTTAIGTSVVGETGAYSISPTTPLANGLHTLTTKQTDAAGNISGPSAALVLTIDDTTPATPTGLGLLAADDSGVLGDAITNSALPIITGAGTAGDTVTLAVDGVTIGIGVVDGGGAFAIAPHDPFSNGTYDVTATETNAAGTVSDAAGMTLIILNQTPATPGQPVLNALDDTGASDTDGGDEGGGPGRHRYRHARRHGDAL